MILKKRREGERSERGDSLVGVLVALLLCSLIVLGIMQMVTYGTRMNLEAKRQTRAFALAQEKMEELLRAPLTSTALAEGTYESEPEPGYGLTWVVTEDDPAPNSRSILVRVETGGGADARCVSLLEYRY